MLLLREGFLGKRFKSALLQPHAILHRAAATLLDHRGSALNAEKRNTKDTENHRESQRNRPFSSRRLSFSFSGNPSEFSVAFLCDLCVKFRKARSITYAPRRPISDRINDPEVFPASGSPRRGNSWGMVGREKPCFSWLSSPSGCDLRRRCLPGSTNLSATCK